MFPFSMSGDTSPRSRAQRPTSASNKWKMVMFDTYNAFFEHAYRNYWKHVVVTMAFGHTHRKRYTHQLIPIIPTRVFERTCNYLIVPLSKLLGDTSPRSRAQPPTGASQTMENGTCWLLVLFEHADIHYKHHLIPIVPIRVFENAVVTSWFHLSIVGRH